MAAFAVTTVAAALRFSIFFISYHTSDDKCHNSHKNSHYHKSSHINLLFCLCHADIHLQAVALPVGAEQQIEKSYHTDDRYNCSHTKCPCGDHCADLINTHSHNIS